MSRLMKILGSLICVLSLPLVFAIPVVGIIGIAFGSFIIWRSTKPMPTFPEAMDDLQNKNSSNRKRELSDEEEYLESEEPPYEYEAIEKHIPYFFVLNYIARLGGAFNRKYKILVIDFLLILEPEIDKEIAIKIIGTVEPKANQFKLAIKELRNSEHLKELVKVATDIAGNNQIKQGAVTMLVEGLEKVEHPPVTENSFDFLVIKMLYQKKAAKEPTEYSLKLKELYKKDGIHYIKAIKDGERNVKSFRVDRIKKIYIDETEIQEPLQFLLKGEISVSD